VKEYIALGCVPGGTLRNFDSYGHKASVLSEQQRSVLCDPQTSGGLLIAVSKDGAGDLEKILIAAGITPVCIGSLTSIDSAVWVEVV